MTRRHSLLIGLMLISAMSAISLPVRSDPPTGTILPSTAILPSQAQQPSVAKDFGRLPLSFESNQGQTDAKVRFLTHSGGNTLFLTPSEAVFSIPVPLPTKSIKKPALRKDRKSLRAAAPTANTALRMQLVGANPKAEPLTQQPLPGRINYFIGNNPSKWHAGVPTFGRVGFHAVYPGVDMVYYGNQRNLEYDFLVAPRADPKQIQLHFAGAQNMHVNAAGDLIVSVQGREMKWQKPAVYQQNATDKHVVAAHFHLKKLPGGQTNVSFALGHYDTNRSLTIDPILSYSTYLGGSSGDWATAIAVDNTGNAYVTGNTSSLDFPVTPGAFQPKKNAQTTVYNAFVTKVNSTGTALVYSTYLGGSGGGDYANSIAVDSNGNAYITGGAGSADFPTTPGAFQRVNLAGDAFVTKLNSAGTTLLYSTFLGGSDESRGTGIVVDSSDNAYVTGYTQSTDFPTTPGAFQGVNKALLTDAKFTAFVAKFNSTGTALLYSTYLGGSGGEEFAFGIAIDSSGDTYITGETNSTDFPTTHYAFQSANNSGGAAFVTQLNSTGTGLVYSTYLGSARANGIAIDSSGNAYVTGYTVSTDFPTTSGAFQEVKKGGEDTYNAFVAELNFAGTDLVYATYLGGSSGDQANSIAIDSSGNAYVTGYTYSIDFPTTPGAFQRVNHGHNAFVTKLDSNGWDLIYSSYLGGTGSGDGDVGYGIAIDSGGNVYIAGFTPSTNFPVTPGAFQPTSHFTNTNGGSNAFVTKLSPTRIFPDFNNAGHTDILIQNSTTNAIACWFMQGASWLGGAYFSLTPPSDYALVGVGDFSGNGSTTLVLQSKSTNQIAFWYTSGNNNATISGGNFVSVTPAAGWKAVGVGDFNGDGKSDLVFQNQTTNQVAIWFMNGYLYQGGVLMPYTPPAGWTAVGTGDFNGDGFTDIAFQNQSTGQIALWYMNRSTYAGGTVLTTTPASGWKVVGVGDYNGDGYADLLLQNQTSNQAVVWYLKNGAYAGGAALSLTPPTGWKIVGPR